MRALATLVLLSATFSGAARAQNAPQNFAPNSQWEIWSGVGYTTAENPLGTGTVAQIAASGNTTGTAGTTTFTVTTTDFLAVGQLVTAGGAGVDPALTIAPMRVTALVPNQSITVRVPLGLAPAVNHAATLTPIVARARPNCNAVPAVACSGDAADGWKKTPPMQVWREIYAGNITPNARYALGATKDVSTAKYLTIQFVTRREMASWAGKGIVFGAYVNQKVKSGGGTWSIVFNDSVNGIRTCPAVSASIGYQWAECAVNIPLNSSYLYVGLSFNGSVGNYLLCRKSHS